MTPRAPEEARFSRAAIEAKAELDREIRRVAYPWTAREVTRNDGQAPYSLTAIGGRRILRQGTGEIAVNGTETVHLTADGQARGEGIFGPVPKVWVWRDVDATKGGLVRASGPPAPSKALRLTPHFNFQLEWDPGNGTYKVVVTNDSATSTGFLVDSDGWR